MFGQIKDTFNENPTRSFIDTEKTSMRVILKINFGNTNPILKYLGFIFIS